jgi:hypothetical protein
MVRLAKCLFEQRVRTFHHVGSDPLPARCHDLEWAA